jgi:hypothetical protein
MLRLQLVGFTSFVFDIGFSCLVPGQQTFELCIVLSSNKTSELFQFFQKKKRDKI